MPVRAGQPPKTIEQRRMLGNPSRRPLADSADLVALPAAVGVPQPHRPLGAVGRSLWERVWTCGAIWVARDVDCETVLMTCEMADERVALRVKVLTHGDPVERKALRDIERALMNSLGMLGFNPTDRVRLGVAEVKRVSKIEELQSRAAARAVNS